MLTLTKNTVTNSSIDCLARHKVEFVALPSKIGTADGTLPSHGYDVDIRRYLLKNSPLVVSVSSFLAHSLELLPSELRIT